MGSTRDLGVRQFGTSIDPNNSKNVDERCFFQRIKKVIEVVNKSEYLQGAFEEAMLELLETYLKLLNSPQHRLMRSQVTG